MGSSPLRQQVNTFDNQSEHNPYFLVGEAFAPDVHQRHQEDLSEEIYLEDAADDDATCEQQHQQPQEIMVFLSRKHLGLNLVQGYVGEVNAEDERKVEFAHVKNRSQRSPELKVHYAHFEGVEEVKRSDEPQGDEQGHRSTDGEIGAGEEGLGEVPNFEVCQSVLHYVNIIRITRQRGLFFYQQNKIDLKLIVG